MRALPRLAATLLLCAPAPAAFATDFGTVELVTGQVSVQLQDGRVIVPRVGDILIAGAELSTGRDGELQIETLDGGFIALRANTRLRVADYRAEGDELDTQILSLVRGTFRSITGWIGRYNQDRYKVTTPTATIGVRGTDHEPSFLTEDDVMATAAEAGLEAGTYDKVNEGASYIETDAGRVDLAASQAGFAARAAQPLRLRKVPGFFKGSRNEKRILERREQLKKVIEQRRAEKRAKLKERLQRAQERREQRRDRRRGN